MQNNHKNLHVGNLTYMCLVTNLGNYSGIISRGGIWDRPLVIGISSSSVCGVSKLPQGFQN